MKPKNYKDYLIKSIKVVKARLSSLTGEDLKEANDELAYLNMELKDISNKPSNRATKPRGYK